MELFKAVLKWTDNECVRQGINIEEDKTARRRVLGDSVYEIRFPAMSHEDILKDVSSTEILTDTEMIFILKKINGLDVAGLQWKEAKKRQPAVVSFERFNSVKMQKDAGWQYVEDSDALTLTVNKAVLFHGVRLFGNTDGSQYEVNFTIKHETVTGTYTSQLGSDHVPGYNVMLSQAISLLPNEEITMIATIKGANSYFGEEGKSSMKIMDIIVTFKDAPSGSSGNCTSKGKGQFYEIFLSEL